MTSGNSAPHNIVLAGFMGTGKTTVGRLVADRLGWLFIDTDDVIEARANRTIAAIFAESGESAFRALEVGVCAELAGRARCVIATGGGALLDPVTRAAFAAQGLLVGLHADLDEIIRRVGADPARPLFSADRAHLAQLLAQRIDVYASLPVQIDTSHLTPEQVAEDILRLWQQTQ